MILPSSEPSFANELGSRDELVASIGHARNRALYRAVVLCLVVVALFISAVIRPAAVAARAGSTVVVGFPVVRRQACELLKLFLTATQLLLLGERRGGTWRRSRTTCSSRIAGIWSCAIVMVMMVMMMMRCWSSCCSRYFGLSSCSSCSSRRRRTARTRLRSLRLRLRLHRDSTAFQGSCAMLRRRNSCSKRRVRFPGFRLRLRRQSSSTHLV